MQRRAAAAYATLLLVIAAGAYAMIAVAKQPSVSIEDPDYAKRAGETITIDGRAWTVGAVSGGSTELAWVNTSERQTATIDNGTVLPPADAHWPGQRAGYVISLHNGSAIRHAGSEHLIRVESGASPGSVALVNLTTGEVTTSIDVGGTLSYRGNETTVAAITSANVTIAWGDSYRVLVPNASNPTSNVSDPSRFAFRQVRDVERHLRWDPAVENETVTRADGERYVVYEATNRTVPLSAYVSPLDVKNFSEGESFVYRGNQVTVENVTAESVIVAWRGPVEHTISLSEGSTIEIDGTEYVAHFPGDGTLELSSDVEEYRDQVEAREYFTERINGLWGVVILSGLAAVFLIAGAYLPSRY